MIFAAATSGRPLLVVAHPGHELRLYGWVHKMHPCVVLLTDGSGSTGTSRVDLSRSLLEKAGAEMLIGGHFAEPDLYAMILDGDTSPLVDLAQTLADILVEKNANMLVCDALEGYHPAHDLCVPLTQAAIALAKKSAKRHIPHYEYRVIGDPHADPDPADSLRLILEDSMLREKIRCSRDYAKASGSVLTQEVEYMFDTFGESAFRFEVLRSAGSERPRLHEGLRYFELRGEEQVRAGRYQRVVRHVEHMLPIEAALQAHVAAVVN